jgi:hypothetical protein
MRFYENPFLDSSAANCRSTDRQSNMTKLIIVFFKLRAANAWRTLCNKMAARASEMEDARVFVLQNAEGSTCAKLQRNLVTGNAIVHTRISWMMIFTRFEAMEFRRSVLNCCRHIQHDSMLSACIHVRQVVKLLKLAYLHSNTG